MLQKNMTNVHGCRRYGTTRTVYLIGCYAFKFPTTVSWRLFLTGLIANMNEKQFSGVYEVLCPVLFHIPGGFLTVMKRAEPLPREIFFEEDFYDNFILQMDGVKDLVENKLCSFGIVDGKIVAVDYG